MIQKPGVNEIMEKGNKRRGKVDCAETKKVESIVESLRDVMISRGVQEGEVKKGEKKNEPSGKGRKKARESKVQLQRRWSWTLGSVIWWRYQ